MTGIQLTALVALGGPVVVAGLMPLWVWWSERREDRAERAAAAYGRHSGGHR